MVSPEVGNPGILEGASSAGLCHDDAAGRDFASLYTRSTGEPCDPSAHSGEGFGVHYLGAKRRHLELVAAVGHSNRDEALIGGAGLDAQERRVAFGLVAHGG